MIFIFWSLIFLVLYTYLGYPLLVAFLAKFNKNKIIKKELYPNVSIIISAHNEEINIRTKLENTIKLDYPKANLEVIVASDASDDGTDNIVKEFTDKKVRLFRTEERVGKTEVQNLAVKEAKGEILVFSDATTFYEPSALKKIVRNFADPKVGAVGGELVYINKSDTSVGQGNGLYWKYEKFLKSQESQFSSLIGVSGCCYALRKELYESIRPDLISDFVIAQIIYKKGKRVVYEPEAISYEETNIDAEDEFKMRVRVAVRTFYGLWCMRTLLNPFKYGFFSVQLISHKILRYFIPLFLIMLLFINLILTIQNEVVFYKFTLCLQIIFYLFALIGRFFKKSGTALYIPFYFLFTNFALLIGLFKFLKGEKRVLWNPLRK